jgi:hypothetical protein
VTPLSPRLSITEDQASRNPRGTDLIQHKPESGGLGRRAYMKSHEAAVAMLKKHVTQYGETEAGL